MPTFRVHFEDGAILTVAANSPEAAANHARKEFPGAIVTKTKLDRSGGVPARALNKRDAAAKLSERFKVIQHKQELVPQTHNVSVMTEMESLIARGDLAEYKIINGRNGTLIVDEYHIPRKV